MHSPFLLDWLLFPSVLSNFGYEWRFPCPVPVPCIAGCLYAEGERAGYKEESDVQGRLGNFSGMLRAKLKFHEIEDIASVQMEVVFELREERGPRCFFCQFP